MQLDPRSAPVRSFVSCIRTRDMQVGQHFSSVSVRVSARGKMLLLPLLLCCSTAIIAVSEMPRALLVVQTPRSVTGEVCSKAVLVGQDGATRTNVLLMVSGMDCARTPVR